MSEAVEVLAALLREPIETTLDRIEIVRLVPFEVIGSHTLPT